jgi:GntR family transcriptional repressor for pyruvate dehydrogenase complex
LTAGWLGGSIGLTMVSEATPLRGERPPSGVQRVLGFIKNALLAGRLRPGDRLLPERELAASLAVSRPVLREALGVLAGLGLVETRQGSGTLVRRPAPEALGDFFTFALAAGGAPIDDVMHARIAIECQAIRLACERAGPAELASLRARLDAILDTLEDPRAGGLADAEFHAALVAAAGSPTLSTLYGALSELLLASHVTRRQETIGVQAIRDSLAEAHRAVFAALLARDADAADAQLRMHFRIGDELRAAGLRTSGNEVQRRA